MKHNLSLLILILLYSALGNGVQGQNVGETYLLERPGKTIPGHPGPSNMSISIRFEHGSRAEVLEFDSNSGWFLISVGGNEAWIVKKYFGQRVNSQPTPIPNVDSYVVGTWNLEWFHTTRTRGFPENTRGGPTYQARNETDYSWIANTISNDLNAAVLVLTEINAGIIDTEEGSETRSVELDRLLLYLGEEWDYIISESGNQQHVAILYDQNKVFLNCAVEITVDRQIVQNKDIFARDPLVAYFTVIRQGIQYNDFVIVGLHLASGQRNNRNHDQAMTVLLTELDNLKNSGFCIPNNEEDIIITGDLNLSIFHSPNEQVIVDMEQGDYDILADTGSYPATRLKGEPLNPGSYIDYIIVSDEMRGNSREIRVSQATVHQELAGGNYYFFREHFSDHFPVTVQLHLVADDD